MELDARLLVEAQEVYLSGENVMLWARRQLNVTHNTEDVIALAYDLQSGTYLDFQAQNSATSEARASELAGFFRAYATNLSSMVDLGSGEINQFVNFQSKLGSLLPKDCIALDISWSRLAVGKKALTPDFLPITPVVANFAELPFPTSSVDMSFSDHALEPNGGSLRQIVAEIFRVTRRFCFFVEPVEALQSQSGKRRMASHGYISKLREVLIEEGGQIVDSHQVINNWNDDNRAEAFVVEPPPKPAVSSDSEGAGEPLFTFTFPGTDFKLVEQSGWLHNSALGVAFPVLEGIPVLLRSSALLATRLGQ